MAEAEQPKVDTQSATGTPLVTDEMVANQEEISDFKLPTNEEVLDEQGKSDDNNAKSEDDKGNGAAAGDGSGKTEPPKAQAPTQEEQVEYVDDPGEFKPGEHTFEVTIYDGKGANGKQVKVNSLEEWDELLEKEPNLGTSAAVGKAFRAASKMERDIETERKDWEGKKKEYDEAVKAQTDRDETVNLWVKEMDYLIAQGEMPPISDELRNANWADPNVAKEPAVKAQVALLNYMRDENTKRGKAGLPLIRSVLDAFQGFARQRDKVTTTEARKQAGEGRREAGAKVAGSAPQPPTAAPRGIAVGRVVSLD